LPEWEQAIHRLLRTDEPHAMEGCTDLLDLQAFQARHV
jgi:hypothetical protein